jgi:molecular chaperone Hsp33
VTADSHGNVKGFPGNPSVDIPPRIEPDSGAVKLDVGGAVGSGILTVSMDLGLKEPYNGQVELQTGEIGEDLAYYFTVSEQTPSAVALGVMVGTDSSVLHSGGFIIQLMPGTAEKTIDVIEKNLKTLPSITQMLSSGMYPEDMIERALSSLSPVEEERHSVSFSCDCSRQRVLDTILTLPKKDIYEMISEKKPVEVKCSFCGTDYIFETDELLTEIKK